MAARGDGFVRVQIYTAGRVCDHPRYVHMNFVVILHICPVPCVVIWCMGVEDDSRFSANVKAFIDVRMFDLSIGASKCFVAEGTDAPSTPSLLCFVV